MKNCSNKNELECIKKLRAACFRENRQVSNDLIIRYAVHHSFNYGKAKDAIDQGYDYSCLYLEMEGELMRYCLQSRVCFPLTGLKSRKTGSEVFYFNPSRYVPTSKHNNHLLLDNFCYVLNDMSRTIGQCRNGVVMLINLDGFSIKNFHNDTQMKATRIFEGQVVPTRVVEILIVNSPKVSHWLLATPPLVHRRLPCLISLQPFCKWRN